MTHKPLSALAAPFDARDIDWRAQSTGKTREGKPWVKVLAYIDNRAIMERLDEVCGPENWRNEYKPAPDGGILCGISIRIVRAEHDSEWVTKWDGAENTDIEGVKGGLSGAMKRAGCQWGIGRYLYNLDEGWGVVSEGAKNYVGAKPDKHGDAFKWNPPPLPVWALPGGSGKPGVASPAQEARSVQAATADAANTRLPGAPHQLGGQGGKRIGDVGDEDLRTVMDGLRSASKYPEIVEAIGTVLADRASA